jgi:hypothetical protein
MKACGILVGWGSMLQAGRSWVWVRMGSLNFFNLSNPSSCTLALVLTQSLTELSTSKCLWGVEHGQCIRLTTSLPSARRLSTQCGIFNISQPCRLWWLVTGIALVLLYMQRKQVLSLVNEYIKCHESCIKDY